MMDSGPVRNTYSTLSNKSEKQCVSLAFITRIYHDGRSSECQIQQSLLAVPKTHGGVGQLITPLTVVSRTDWLFYKAACRLYSRDISSRSIR